MLESFPLRGLRTTLLPKSAGEEAVKEYREAELCITAEAWRAASAMIRSTLEKPLKVNGYTKCCSLRRSTTQLPTAS